LHGAIDVLAIRGTGVEPGKQIELGPVSIVHSSTSKKASNCGMMIEEGVIHGKEENLGRVFVLAADAPTFLLMLGSVKTTGVDCFSGYGDYGWLERENPGVDNRAILHN